MGAVCSAPSGIAASNCQSSNLNDGSLSAADELAIPPIRTLGLGPQNLWDTPPICSIRHSGQTRCIGSSPHAFRSRRQRFTESSRRGLQVRYWSEDSVLVRGPAPDGDTGGVPGRVDRRMEPFESDWDLSIRSFLPWTTTIKHSSNALRGIDPNPTMIACQVAMTPAVRWIRVERRSAIELDDLRIRESFSHRERHLETPPRT